MHYIGMAAMRLDAIADYNPALVALSVLIAFGASGLGLGLAFNLADRATFGATISKIGSAILMGNAIAAMHYTAMAAVSFRTTKASTMPLSHSMNHSLLAVAVAIATLIILLLGLIASLVDRRLSIEIARAEERQQAAAALQQSESKFRSMVANIPGVVYRCACDSNWTMEYISDAVEEIFGYPACEFINNQVRSFASIIHPEDRGMVEQTVFNSLAEKQPYLINYRIKRADNSYSWVQEKGQGIFNDNGSWALLNGVILDITSRKQNEEELDRTQNFLNSIVENIPNSVVVKDSQNLRLVLSNKASEELVGYSKQELIGKSDYDFFPKEQADLFTAKDREVLANKQSLDIPEEFIQTKHQGVRIIHTKKIPLLDSAGNSQYLLAISEDITNRKETEIVLQRYQLLSEHTRDIVLFLRSDGQIIEANHAAVKAYGYERAELLSLNIYDLRDPQTYNNLADQMAKSQEQGILYETIHRRKDGSKFHLEVSSKGAVIGNEKLILNINRDITKRKQTEQELKEREAAIRSLYKVTSARRINFEGRLQGLLALGRRLFGLEMGALARIENQRYEVVASQIPPKINFKMPKGSITDLLLTYCSDAILAKEPICFESARTSKWCNHPAYTANKLEAFIGTPVIVNSKIYGTLSFFSHQPRSKLFNKGDRELMKLIAQWVGGEIERLQAEEEIRKALLKEQELNELKSRFISMASHEFRTPLSTILSSTELIKIYGHKFTEEKKEKHFDKITSAVKLMVNLLDDVLFIGKAEAGKIEFNPTNINLQAFCQEILEDLTLANNQHHSFVFESHGDCDRVEMDQKLLRQMLTNLLSNAVKYSLQGGTIHLKLVCQQEQVIFHIKDEGIGIPDADRERLFEVFHRASNVGTIPGTGLGMAIIKKAVDLHQGSITFSSSVGKGTTFTVCLPTRTK